MSCRRKISGGMTCFEGTFAHCRAAWFGTGRCWPGLLQKAGSLIGQYGESEGQNQGIDNNSGQ